MSRYEQGDSLCPVNEVILSNLSGRSAKHSLLNGSNCCNLVKATVTYVERSPEISEQTETTVCFMQTAEVLYLQM